MCRGMNHSAVMVGRSWTQSPCPSLGKWGAKAEIHSTEPSAALRVSRLAEHRATRIDLESTVLIEKMQERE